MLKRIGLGVAFILIAGSIGYAIYRYWPDSDQTQFETATAQIGTVEDAVTASGTLQPRDYVDVGVQVSGQLRKLHVDVGSEVKTGDLLAELDPAVYLSRVDADRAQLATQHAQLKSQEAQLILAEQQYAREQNLMREGATSDDALQQAEAGLASARAEIDALKSEIEQTESSLRGNQANLGYTKIYAPMSGTVVSLSAKQGQTLNANQSAPIVLRIADLSIMTIQAQVSEADVSKLRTDMEVYFTTLGNRQTRWYSTLRQIQPTPTVTNNVVLYNALFDVPNPDKVLMTQMTTQVFFILASARDVLLIPITALQQDTGGISGRNGERSNREGRFNGAERPERAERSNRPERPQNGDRSDRTGKPGTGPFNASAGDRQRPGDNPRGNRESRRGESLPAPQDGGKAGAVRILKADGIIETRPVTIGVTNRVSAQILAGLEPGEEVITGEKVKEAERASARSNDTRPGPPPRL